MSKVRALCRKGIQETDMEPFYAECEITEEVDGDEVKDGAKELIDIVEDTVNEKVAERIEWMNSKD